MPGPAVCRRRYPFTPGELETPRIMPSMRPSFVTLRSCREMAINAGGRETDAQQVLAKRQRDLVRTRPALFEQQRQRVRNAQHRRDSDAPTQEERGIVQIASVPANRIECGSL